MTGTASTAGVRPADAALLVDFTNTLDVTEGTDEITTPAELVRWLRSRDLLPSAVGTATATDLRLALDLRAALHTAFAAHHDGYEDGADLAGLAARLPLRVEIGPEGPVLHPVDTGVAGALAAIVAAVSSTGAAGTWRRINVCLAGDCTWAFYDATKNRSRSWCEWGCGNKAKTRSYRARRRATAQ